MEVLEEGELKNCLICNVGINCVDKTNCPKLFDELHVIFVLQNILEVPTDTLGEYLRKWGSPSEWEVELCENCGDSVKNAKKIYAEMLASMKKYKEVKRDIVENVKGSVDKNRRDVKKAREIKVTAESRDFVWTHKYGPLNDPFVDGDLKAEDVLSKSTSSVDKHLTIKTEPQENTGDQSDASDGCSEAPSFGGGDDFDAENSEEEKKRKPEKVPKPSRVVPSEEGSHPARTRQRPCPKSKKAATTPPSKKPKKPPSKKFADVNALHGPDPTKSDGFVCKCGKVYSSRNNIVKHLNRIRDVMSGVTHQCELCKNATPSVNRTFTRKQELRRHILDYHEGRRSICPLCGKPFIPKKLAYHMRMEHEHGL